jgi:KDO2-lipid IV(A) lauroyltransferase
VKLRQEAVEFGYAAAWRVVRALPRPVATGVFNAAGDLITRRGGKSVTRLAENLRRVVGPARPEPEFHDLVRAGMRSYARYYMDSFRLPSRSKEQIGSDFELVGEEEFAAAMKRGKGLVVALPHGGNYDVAGAWVAARGWPIVTVAERLRPEGLYQRFLDFRRSLGMEIVPNTGGEKPAFDVLLERLGQGYAVPLLGDRDLSVRGVDVRFFGGRARMPAGPALLALRTGAPLYVADMYYEPAGPRGHLHGPLDLPTEGPLDQRVRQVTQLIADRFAEGITRHPADWHMLQRLWLPELPGPGAAPAAAPTAAAEQAR